MAIGFIHHSIILSVFSLTQEPNRNDLQFLHNEVMVQSNQNRYFEYSLMACQRGALAEPSVHYLEEFSVASAIPYSTVSSLVHSL